MKINDKHIRAIELLLKGMSPKTICSELNISLSGLRKWKADKDFQFEYEMMRDEMKGRMFQKMLSLHDLAHNEVLKVLSGEDTQSKIKVLPLVYSNIWNSEKQVTTDEILRKVNYLEKGFEDLRGEEEEDN